MYPCRYWPVTRKTPQGQGKFAPEGCPRPLLVQPSEDPPVHRPTVPEDLDLAEDKRLRRLGIDPIGDPVDFIIRLRKKQEELEQENEEKQQKPAG
jgi:hypothetical protein